MNRRGTRHTCVASRAAENVEIFPLPNKIADLASVPPYFFSISQEGVRHYIGGSRVLDGTWVNLRVTTHRRDDCNIGNLTQDSVRMCKFR